MLTEEITFNDTWNNRAEALNGKSYKDYKLSYEWISIEKRLNYSGKYKQCLHCKSLENIVLHHRTYRFLNTHLAGAFIDPLCVKCVKEVFNYAKENDFSIQKSRKLIHRKILKTIKREKLEKERELRASGILKQTSFFNENIESLGVIEPELIKSKTPQNNQESKAKINIKPKPQIFKFNTKASDIFDKLESK